MLSTSVFYYVVGFLNTSLKRYLIYVRALIVFVYFIPTGALITFNVEKIQYSTVKIIKKLEIA
jgi:hypothetical protein